MRSGRWTPKEHERFVVGVRRFGKDWNKVAETVKTRTVVQIRTHAQKFFQKIAKVNYENQGKQVPDELKSTAIRASYSVTNLQDALGRLSSSCCMDTSDSSCCSKPSTGGGSRATSIPRGGPSSSSTNKIPVALSSYNSMPNMNLDRMNSLSSMNLNCNNFYGMQKQNTSCDSFSDTGYSERCDASTASNEYLVGSKPSLSRISTSSYGQVRNSSSRNVYDVEHPVTPKLESDVDYIFDHTNGWNLEHIEPQPCSLQARQRVNSLAQYSSDGNVGYDAQLQQQPSFDWAWQGQGQEPLLDFLDIPISDFGFCETDN